MTFPRRVAVAVLVFALGASAASNGLATPNVPGWKRLINPAYTGRITGAYSCASAQQAVRHLPVTLVPYGSSVLALRTTELWLRA
jgi:hypothetical protein